MGDQNQNKTRFPNKNWQKKEDLNEIVFSSYKILCVVKLLFLVKWIREIECPFFDMHWIIFPSKMSEVFDAIWRKVRRIQISNVESLWKKALKLNKEYDKQSDWIIPKRNSINRSNWKDKGWSTKRLSKLF